MSRMQTTLAVNSGLIMKLYYLVFLSLVACGHAKKGNDPTSTGVDPSYKSSPGGSSTNQDPGQNIAAC